MFLFQYLLPHNKTSFGGDVMKLYNFSSQLKFSTVNRLLAHPSLTLIQLKIDARFNSKLFATFLMSCSTSISSWAGSLRLYRQNSINGLMNNVKIWITAKLNQVKHHKKLLHQILKSGWGLWDYFLPTNPLKTGPLN